MQVILVILSVSAISLKLLNVLLHSIGYYLLRSLPTQVRHTAQNIYIINLSVIELLINALSFTRNLFKMLPLHFHPDHLRQALTYSYIFDIITLKVLLYATMFYITLDRLLAIQLDIRYPLYWNHSKAKRLIQGTWLFSGLLFIGTVVYYAIEGNDLQTLKFCQGITLLFGFLFVLFAIPSYCAMFFKFKRRNDRFAAGGCLVETFSRQSILQAFLHSRFYVACLIVATFALFVIPVDFTWWFAQSFASKKFVSLVLTILHAVSFLLDGLIYIFGQENVRKLFLRKMRWCKSPVQNTTAVPRTVNPGQTAKNKEFTNDDGHISSTSVIEGINLNIVSDDRDNIFLNPEQSTEL